MPKTLVFLMVLLVALTTLAEDAKPAEVREVRQHYQVVGKQGAVVYEVTDVDRSSEQSSESYLLVRDTDHGDFVIRHVWSFNDQVSTYRMSDVKDRSFIQVSTKHPFVSKTRTETLEESRRNPNIKMLPAIVKLETNGGRWDSSESEWEDLETLRRLRHQVRRSMDFFLLEAIERMRETPLTTSEAQTFYSLVGQLVVYDPREGDNATVELKKVDAAPDCDFDEHLGFPCSPKRLERVMKAAKEGKSLPHY